MKMHALLRALPLLVVTSSVAHASRPIQADESLACIGGYQIIKGNQKQSIVFDNSFSMEISPDTLSAFVALKSRGQHIATFFADGIAMQKLDFSFEDSPGSDVCFVHEGGAATWSMVRIEKNLCQRCR